MIINTLLDTDLYKFTMMQVVLHHFPGAFVEYRFQCRTPNIDLTPYVEEIKEEIRYLCALNFREDELLYLSEFRFFKTDFIEFLRIFQLNPNFISITTDDEFALTIKGPWLHTILFEVPILAIIAEVYARNTHQTPDYEEGRTRLAQKIKHVISGTPAAEFRFSEFGTRRRFSGQWQLEVLEKLKQQLPDNLSGTSNVHLARELDLRPHGTMAHEYVQACQASGPRLIDSQQFAFEKWAQEYRGDLGIALTDTYGIDAFLRDFDLYFCKLFDGVRHDSGDPFKWGEKILEHYETMRVDARTKTLVFSDSLDMKRAVELFWHFRERCLPVFGIGTSLTNDLGYSALQIVIKMTECNGQPVAKISDSPEKAMCKDPSYLTYLKQVFKIG